MSFLILYATCLALLVPASGAESKFTQAEPLSIGLLIPDGSYTSVVNAAQMAIDEANQQRAHGELSFTLIVRTTDGPWGAGSKQSVSLVYDDKVRAILGSLDGRNAHLAEQVAAKSHLVYLETRATDPTLSQAYVPWFFRIVPNDEQQSRALLKEIDGNGDGQIAILSREQYDTRYAVKSFIKYAARENGKSPLILQVDSTRSDAMNMITQLKEAQINHLVIPFYSESAFELIGLIRGEMPTLCLYGTLAFCARLKEEDLSRKELLGMTLIHSYAPEMNKGQFGDLYALYAYDGVNLILNAIEKAGSDRESIKDSLYTVNYAEGMSGPVRFDDMGNRTGVLRFSNINKGRLEPAD